MDGLPDEISMSIPAEATMPQVVQEFECFLRAMGYPLQQNESLEIIAEGQDIVDVNSQKNGGENSEHIESESDAERHTEV